MQLPLPNCPIPGAAGRVYPVGPVNAPILLIGEAGGKYEALKGEPFVGDAGFQLDKLLRMRGWDRADLRIGNVIQCHPPNDWLVGAPWEGQALRHCQPQLNTLLDEGHKVVVTLGASALRAVGGFPKSREKEGIRLNDFHGAPFRDRYDRFWIVPTFHPSFLLRGAQKLTKVVFFDLGVAEELAKGAWTYDLPTLVIDPPIDWVRAWATGYLDSIARDPEGVWLAVDVETPEKADANEDEIEFGGGRILRINFSSSVDEGITVPWAEPYISVAREVIEAKGIKVYWNAPFDLKKLREAGIISGGLTFDFMDGFKVIQSALPRSLGFVAPFYSRCPPWKHKGSKDLEYCAMDPVQELRAAHGITQDLHSQGLWDVFFRRMVQLDYTCFRSAELVGMKLNRPELSAFSTKLKGELARLEGEVQGLIPDELRPLSGALVNHPEPEDLIGPSNVIEKKVQALIRICTRCGESQVGIKHKCADLKKGMPDVTTLQEQEVSRYHRRLPFNLGSRDQILSYVKFRKHKAGKQKKTKADTVDKKTLKRLVRSGDALYPMALEYRQASKMHGTYGKGILEHLDSNDRIHPTFTNTPSTLRKASVNPNAQNLANHVKYANEFRRCVEAAPGCKLISADYSGLEAVHVGWLMGDPQYIKLAKLGIHAYVSTHHLKIDGQISEAADPNWSVADLQAMFKDVKKRFRDYYEKDKRVVHGVNYLLSEYGLVDYYPESFPKKADAARIISIYEEVCPKLRPWQKRTLRAAHEKHYLGGPLIRQAQDHSAWYWEMINQFAHPFGYKHWFWDVVSYSRGTGGKWKESMGSDAKRTIAFGPQSQGMGTISEAMLRLYTPPKSHPKWDPMLHGNGGTVSFIGDAYFGETPLRAQIHDDITNEVPDHLVEAVLTNIVKEMTRPILQMPMPVEWGLGDYLSIGVEVKVGRNWAPVDPEHKWSSDGNPDGMQVVGIESLAGDAELPEDEDDDDL